MKKYLLISVSYGKLKRGAFTISERMVSEHSEYLDHIESKNVVDLKELNEKYKRIIFVTQVPSNYSSPVNIISLKDINYLIYVRNEHNFFGHNSCNNGFYYTYDHKDIKNFIPMITDFIVEQIEITRPCLGFYVRNYITMDSFDHFLGMLNNLYSYVDVYTMGQNIRYDFSKRFKYVLNHRHTFDQQIFFSNITHYVYPQSRNYIDPLPYSLIEAIQNNKELILPKLKGRSHRDGIDDIKDFIGYHDRFIPGVHFYNIRYPFMASNFKNFYKDVFDNNFEHVLDRNKYNTFIDWIVGEVLCS